MVVPQTTPRESIVAPPVDITFPPLKADDSVIPEIAVVVIVGTTGELVVVKVN